MRTPEPRASHSGPVRAALLLPLALAGRAFLACTRGRPSTGKQEQVFRFRLHEDPPTLDPALDNDQFSEAVILNVNRGLVELDPKTLEIRPAVAESWTVSPDGLVYTFRLRDDVLFHNGRRVMAQDVAYSF